jgi:HAD superfamily hydrolase (TIGR01490 family)
MNPSCAFFDVDETLVKFKSMFRFLRYYLASRGETSSTYERLAGELHSAAARGEPREEINRRYYRCYAGEDVARLAAAGIGWFESERAGGAFIRETLAELRRRQTAGEPVILLSGSFFACLDPVAAEVGVTWSIGTRPVIRRGVLTGEVVVPMIGAHKARAAHAVAAIAGLSLPDCSAYADHVSDLRLLQSVGHPYVVGDDQVLSAHARRGGWQRLASTAATTSSSQP